jgi:hypothetical protein
MKGNAEVQQLTTSMSAVVWQLQQVPATGNLIRLNDQVEVQSMPTIKVIHILHIPTGILAGDMMKHTVH